MFGIFKNLFNQGKGEDFAMHIKEGAYLVDVRTPQEFAGGSVKGAINIPLDKVQSQLTKFKDQKHIIVFCSSANRSSQAKSILAQNGFADVTNGGTFDNVNQFVKQ